MLIDFCWTKWSAGTMAYCAYLFALVSATGDSLTSPETTDSGKYTIGGIFVSAQSASAVVTWNSSRGWLVKETEPSVTLTVYLLAKEDISGSQVAFTSDPLSCGQLDTVHIVNANNSQHDHDFIDGFIVQDTFTAAGTIYICVRSRNSSVESENGDDSGWFHQGTGPKLSITLMITKKPTSLPTGVAVFIVACCLLLSGMFSGLNLGLMSLDLSDLRVFQEVGSVKEKYYASVIYPLRKRGNFLLCSILLSNTLVNCAQTIVIEGIVHGIYATIVATLGIVIFGEIIPQAICSRHGLAIGAKTAFFTRLVMIITSPLSWPFGKILDIMLGKQGPSAFTREKVRVLLREQVSGVEPEEMDIISGVLALRDKTAEQHMRKLKDVYMVEYNQMFDEKLYALICDSGYSRIPVYKNDRFNVVGVLHVKDLALISTSQHRSVGTICETFNLPFGRCKPADALDKLLRYILQNHFHMLLVQVNKDGIDETIGTITLEDIIEEMLDLEILDEFDANMEQKSNRYRKFRSVIGKNKCSISPQMRVGAVQVLSSLPPFKKEVMSQDVLGKLIEQYYIEEKNCQHRVIYEIGKPSDHFTMIISGKATVEAGREKLRFEVGAFGLFGLPALENVSSEERRQNPFIPDYTVYLTGDVSYLRIARSKWMAATRASALERFEQSEVTVTPSSTVAVEVKRSVSCEGTPQNDMSEQFQDTASVCSNGMMNHVSDRTKT